MGTKEDDSWTPRGLPTYSDNDSNKDLSVIEKVVYIILE